MAGTKTDSEEVIDSTPIRSRKVRFLNFGPRASRSQDAARAGDLIFFFKNNRIKNTGCNSAVLK
jgi:hypothetical protein